MNQTETLPHSECRGAAGWQIASASPSVPLFGRGDVVSNRTNGHLHEDDRVWFVSDSFNWLVEHDRGEPMREQKTHVCFACKRAITRRGALPSVARRRRSHQRQGPRGVLPEAVLPERESQDPGGMPTFQSAAQT